MGIYDLPASVDYILNKTNYKDLLFIGHSQGGTTFFIFGSLRQEYTDKVKAGFMLAPIAYMAHAKSEFLKTISKFSNVLSASLLQKIFSGIKCFVLIIFFLF